MNPPPINRLRIAAGNTKNTARTLKPNSRRTNPPTTTRPRITPSMNPNDPSAATQGNNPVQTEKKGGESSAIAFATISPAAMRNKAAGTHKYMSGKMGREIGQGPNRTPPAGRNDV